MHGQKKHLIALVLAAFLCAPAAFAQKDAAEKAREGGIDHWIEYYQAERRKPAPATPPPTDESVPANRKGAPKSPPRAKAEQN